MFIARKGYRLSFSKKGNMTLLTESSEANNVIQNNCSSFGLPFDRSTQQQERVIPLKLKNQQKNQLSFIGKNVQQAYQFYDDYFTIQTRFSQLRGPRAGVNFDFCFLDSDHLGFENKLMLTEMYIAPNYLYGYLLFRQFNGRYIVMVINDRFTAYRLKYSY